VTERRTVTGKDLFIRIATLVAFPLGGLAVLTESIGPATSRAA
jgi:hypothetical protein